MNLAIQDQLRDIGRQLADLERRTAYIPAREGETYPSGLVAGVADDLIPVGGSGSVNGGAATAVNATGHPIWAGSQIWLDENLQYIVGSNAATLLYGVWNEVGSKANVESYMLDPANRKDFSGTDVINDNFDIVDPAGYLSAIDGSSVVVFATGVYDSGGAKPNALFVLGPDGGGGGGSGDPPWTGWPGPDPDTGVAPGVLFIATVNESSHVTSGDATFSFDNTTAVFGSAPASGTAANVFGSAFINNEEFLCAGNSSGSYKAIKIIRNLATAQVKGAATAADDDFAIDNFTALEGPVPADDAVCLNEPPQSYADDELVLVGLLPSGKWIVLERVTAQNVSVMITSDVTAATMNGTTFAVTYGSGEGHLLTNASGAATDGGKTVNVYNPAKTEIRASTDEPIVLQGLQIGEDVYLSQFDLRSLPGFDSAKVLLPGFDAGTDAELLELKEWIKKLFGWSASKDQSIGHDDSGEPEWQDDTDECPEEE